MSEFKRRQIVKMSESYFEALRQAGCTEESMKAERSQLYKVVEIPAKHGSENSVGVSPVDDKGIVDKYTIVACAKSDLILVSKCKRREAK